MIVVKKLVISTATSTSPNVIAKYFRICFTGLGGFAGNRSDRLVNLAVWLGLAAGRPVRELRGRLGGGRGFLGHEN